MNNQLFKNRPFKIILILFVGIDLISTIYNISDKSEFASSMILKYLGLFLTIISFVSFFVVSKYSLPIIKIYIVLKLIILPLAMLLYALKEFVVYSYNPFIMETYFTFMFSLILGLIIYTFFKKYKIDTE